MTESLHSPLWYRVAQLKPRLRGHMRSSRHIYREETWYVFRDTAGGKVHRLNQVSYYLVGLVNGRRTIEEIWDLALKKFGDDAPTQEEVIRLFGDLHAADALQCDIPPEATELQRRYHKEKRREFLQRFMNPMAVRIPLLDPDRFLARTLPAAGWMFTRLGFTVWLVVVGIALVQAGAHWDELTQNVTDRVLEPGNLLLLLCVFPAIKALHELGHGYAVKRWGGEVHEIGIMLLVLMPVPYVDATASWEFRDKTQRMVVGAAGMLVEVLVGAIAMFAWLALEPGLARSIAFNVMFIAGISTLLFNGNPLLRFDGYYIFADWLEIPNLASRSKSYLAVLAQKYLLGARQPAAIHVQDGERGWLVFYAIASFFYRLLVATLIITFIAGRFFTIGVLLAIWVAIAMLVLPLAKLLKFVVQSPILRKVRVRSIVTSTAAFFAIFALVFVIPMPFLTRAEGVVWLPEQAHVRSGTDGFVTDVVAEPNTQIEAGDLLLRLTDPELLAQVRIARARHEQLSRRYRAERSTDLLAAEITSKELQTVERQLARLEERASSLEVRSESNGRFVLPNPEDLPGKFLRQGDTVGFVIDETVPRVRMVATQGNVDLIRNTTRNISVRLVSRVKREYPASILREVPAASRDLPSAALLREGGGEIANDPSANQPERAFQAFFQFELQLLDAAPIGRFGERVHVRFDHGYAPLWSQWYRRLKILFLRLLDD